MLAVVKVVMQGFKEKWFGLDLSIPPLLVAIDIDCFS